jgi:hypothetical protein
MIWKGLCHPNVLAPLDMAISGNRFGMVSEWMANGNINGFIKVNKHADRLELVSCCFYFSSHPTPTIMLPGSSKAPLGD